MRHPVCSKFLQKIKVEHFRNLFSTFEKENNTKDIFRTTKNLLNWKNSDSPHSFLIDGRLYKRPSELANLQLKFVVNKVDKLTRRFATNNSNPLRWLTAAMDRWQKKGNFEKFTLSPLSLNETVQLLSRLGNSTSLGIDSIDALSIKAAAVDLALPIQHLVNVSLRSAVFANRWKLSKLLPLLKSKELSKLSPGSYRPIAILPAVSKLIEKAAQSQLLKYFEDNKMLNDCTHAYRKGYSTSTTLIEITDRLYEAINENKLASVMTLDQLAAFDCVLHSILIEKLRIYNIDESAIEWIASYLHDRMQFVTIGRANSSMSAVRRGVPQGSVLRPLLYGIYTNEMSTAINNSDCTDASHHNSENLFGPDCKKCGIMTQYADDATYIVTDKIRSVNQRKLVENIGRLKEFLESNKLSVKADKTHLVEVMIQQKRAKTTGEPPTLTVLDNQGNMEIVRDSESCRILGMNIEKDMIFKSHLESGEKALLPSLRRNLGALKSLGRQIPRGSKNTMARGLLLSRLTYLVGIWGGATESLRRRAQVLQNNAARWVTNCNKRTRVTRLLELTGWFSIQEMSQISTATQVWKIINMNTPRRMSRNMSWDPVTKLIDTSEPRIQFTRQGFKYRASCNWNLLPESIRTNSNLGSFKRQIKALMKEQRQIPPD